MNSQQEAKDGFFFPLLHLATPSPGCKESRHRWASVWGLCFFWLDGRGVSGRTSVMVLNQPGMPSASWQRAALKRGVSRAPKAREENGLAQFASQVPRGEKEKKSSKVCMCLG